MGVEKAMSKAWKPIRGMEMVTLEDNLFLFKFFHRMDIGKVLRDGPWRFDENLMVIQEILNESNIDKSILTTIPFWIQIHRVPLIRFNETTARSVGAVFGKVLDVDRDIAFCRRLGCLRVLVDLDVRKRLIQGFNISVNGNEVKIEFKYERLPNFCYWCGFLNHVANDCEQAYAQGLNPLSCQRFSKDLRTAPIRRNLWSNFNSTPSSFGNLGPSLQARPSPQRPFALATNTSGSPLLNVVSGSSRASMNSQQNTLHSMGRVLSLSLLSLLILLLLIIQGIVVSCSNLPRLVFPRF